MKKNLSSIWCIIAFFLMVGIASCDTDALTTPDEEEETKPYCESHHTCNIIVRSSYGDPYYIYINGKYSGVVAANSSKTFPNKPAGFYSIYLEQESGYYFYPTVTDAIAASYDECKNHNVIFVP